MTTATEAQSQVGAHTGRKYYVRIHGGYIDHLASGVASVYVDVYRNDGTASQAQRVIGSTLLRRKIPVGREWLRRISPKMYPGCPRPVEPEFMWKHWQEEFQARQ